MTEDRYKRVKRDFDNITFSYDIENNLEYLKKAFTYPDNEDFIIKTFFKSNGEKCTLAYLIGAVDIDKIEKDLLPAIQKLSQVQSDEMIDSSEDIARTLNFAQVSMMDSLYSTVDKIIMGYVIVFIEGSARAIGFNISKFEHRNIEKPSVENVIKGPKEAFVESRETNKSLIRKILRTESLVSESLLLGRRTTNIITLMYIKDIANNEIIDTVKRRLENIDIDNIANLSILEQHLEDRPFSLVPTILYTERPDRVALFLQDGHVALLDDSASALIVPVTLWSLFHTAEDYYHRWAYANFVRIIRLMAFFFAMMTPALYVAITNYHVEMIPTDLLLAIGASREIVPFPAIVEVFIMELAFEILREAGIRVPTPIGPTIGIVGALILGQAAVEANIVSPILVIIIAITGLSSFAISEVSTNFMVRIGRFVYTAFAAFMGLYGVGICFVVGVAYLASIKSFGVRFFSPYSPYSTSSQDFVYRPQLFNMLMRPFNLKPQDKTKGKQDSD